MLSQAGQVLVMQIDNMMVGRVGTTELAAASFANSVFIIGMVFGMGFTFGLTPLVGHAYARGDFKNAGSLLKNSLYANLIMGIVLSVVLYGISFLMHLMGQPPQVVEEAIPYYRILVVSFLPFLVFFTLKQFVEGIGNTSIAMFVTIGANIINVGLNYVLIFGKMGFPEYGLNGAGYATLIARILMPLFFIFVFFRKDWLRRYLVLFSKARLKLEKVKELFHVGWPISLQLLLEVSAFALSGVMMGWLGEVPLAAHQIALGLASMTFMIVTGIASGTTIRVSHQYSKKDYYGMHKAVMASVHLMLAFMSLTALSFVLFRGWLPQLYTPNREVITLAAQLLIMAAVFQIFDGLQVVILGALRGLADVKTAMVQAFFAYIVVNLPLSYLLTFVFSIGPVGIWIGFVAGLAIASVLFYRRFDKIYRRLAVSTQNVRT
jgi:MATE family multidrug resistance protein